MRISLLAAVSAAAIALAGCSSEPADDATATTEAVDSAAAIDQAVAASDRPEEARALDESRKPAEVLKFLGLTPGMKAADLMPARGYWTEIMAHAVGPDGSVVGLEPEQFFDPENGPAIWEGLSERVPGVTLVQFPIDNFSYDPASLDFAIMNNNYHDLYWESEEYGIPRLNPEEFVTALYAAMKPGGIVGIIDHVGAAGEDTRETVDKYHRIDPAVVKADFEKAGFVLEAQSELLSNPDDAHDILVFDPAIRGKTDRFVMKFVKPE